MWKIGSKFGNETVEPAETASRRGANCRSRCSIVRCFAVRFFHFPLAGSSATTPSIGADAPSTVIVPTSEPFLGVSASSSEPPAASLGCAGVSFGIVFSAVVMRSGAPARNSGSSAVERARRRQPFRRAVKLLGVRALAAQAGDDGGLQQIRCVALSRLSQLVDLRGPLAWPVLRRAAPPPAAAD